MIPRTLKGFLFHSLALSTPRAPLVNVLDDSDDDDGDDDDEDDYTYKQTNK